MTKRPLRPRTATVPRSKPPYQESTALDIQRRRLHGRARQDYQPCRVVGLRSVHGGSHIAAGDRRVLELVGHVVESFDTSLVARIGGVTALEEVHLGKRHG